MCVSWIWCLIFIRCVGDFPWGCFMWGAKLGRINEVGREGIEEEVSGEEEARV